jgi:hypothetical protein
MALSISHVGFRGPVTSERGAAAGARSPVEFAPGVGLQTNVVRQARFPMIRRSARLPTICRRGTGSSPPRCPDRLPACRSVLATSWSGQDGIPTPMATGGRTPTCRAGSSSAWGRKRAAACDRHQIQLDKPPWSGSAQHYRCPGCGGRVDRHIHGMAADREHNGICGQMDARAVFDSYSDFARWLGSGTHQPDKTLQ